MPKPSSIPTWGTDPSTPITTPPAGLQSGGWRIRRKPSVGHVNWFWNLVGSWLDFLSPFFLGDKSITAGRLTSNGDPGGSGKGFYFRVGSLGYGFEIDGTTEGTFDDDVTINIGRNAADGNDLNLNVWDTISILAWNGITINGGISASFGFGYAGSVTKRYTLSPALGGFSQVDGAAYTPCQIDAGSKAWQPIPGGAVTRKWRAPFILAGVSGITSPGTQTLTALRVRLDAPNTATSVTIRVVELSVEGNPESEVVKASFTTASTTRSVDSELTGTIADADLDPLKGHAVEVEITWSNGADVVRIQTIHVDVSRDRVE